MQPPTTDCTPIQRLGRALRHLTPWLLGLTVLLAWPALRHLLTAQATAEVPTADAAAVAAQTSAQFLDLNGPASKLLLAVLAFAVGLGVVWFTLARITPVLAGWARGHYEAADVPAVDFKTEFLHLPPQWRFLVFLGVWLCLLLCFCLCYLAANLVQ